MKYLLHLHEDGGCDYTIGCGNAIIELEVENPADLMKAIEEKLEDYGIDRIYSATVYPYTEKIEIDIDNIIAIRESEAAEAEAAQVEKQERELLSKLKEKYENS